MIYQEREPKNEIHINKNTQNNSKRQSINGKEFDTYKVGTVANSCSTMHKIHNKEFTLEDFSCEHLISDWIEDNNDAMYYWDMPDKETPSHLFASPMDGLKVIIGLLNANREEYLETKDKKYWCYQHSNYSC